MDDISEHRLKLVYPILADKIRQLHDLLEKEGIEIRVIMGLRTWEEQDALYAKGRTTEGPRVTNAHGGQSWHNFGLAVDVCPSQYGPDKPYTPDWNESHPAWKRMVEAGVSLGLTSGAFWRTIHDVPHFQFTGLWPATPNDAVRELYKAGGLKATWEELDNNLGYTDKLGSSP